jgi:hypothetical protein
MIDLDITKQRQNAFKVLDFVDTLTPEFETYQDSRVSKTTKFYKEYNYFLCPLPDMHDLFTNIRETFYSVYKHKHNKLPEKYWIQSWVNFYYDGDYIDWHSHMPDIKDAWHGFYCVDVEPNSSTYYKLNNTVVEIESKNNLVVLSQCNKDQHRSSKWEQTTPRITVAFDIIQYEYTKFLPFAPKNHWMPL